jgi:hypothetical protein
MIEARLAANFYEGCMIPFHLDSSEKLFFDTFRLGCEAHSLIGLRLFEMATGGVPALPEALRMIPEKIEAFVHAQMVVTINVLSGRPDLAPVEVVALYRERVSANEQWLTT